MFKIYIDYDRMYNICLEQDDSDTWYKILCKQQCININHAVDDEEFYNEDNPLLLFSQMNGVEFNDASSYINDVINDNTKVLEQPCGAFILNIDSAKASEIQKRFGVICQSTEEKNAKPLTIGDITITTTTPGTWAKRMPLGKVLPSNTLILIDRYLFGSENDETLQDSYDNILDMMNAFMPETFDSEYHICIIFDTDHIQDRDIKILLESDKSRDFDEEDRKKAFAKISTNISSGNIIGLAPALINVNISESDGWPKKTQGDTIGGVYYGVPINLEKNVTQLHEELFGQTDYECSETVKNISNQIINKTGYSN